MKQTISTVPRIEKELSKAKTKEEIEKSVALAKKYDFEIVLQPRMLDDKMTVSSKFLMSVFEKFVKLYKNTRLIPQVHKFINVE